MRCWVYVLDVVAVVAAVDRNPGPNMNGLYSLSPSGGADPEKTKNLFPKNFKDYPGGVEYFDIYSPPIRSLYSQVFWKSLPPVSLPADVVAKFDGKAMAVVGFE